MASRKIDQPTHHFPPVRIWIRIGPVVLDIHGESEPELPEIAQARYAHRLALGSRQNRQQQRGEQREDRDDNKQLNQGESAPAF